MQGAEILITSGRRECERVCVIGVERFRPESTARCGDGVRDIVLVYPGDDRPGFHLQHLRIEGEIANFNLRLFRARRTRPCDHERDGDKAQEKDHSNGAAQAIGDCPTSW